MSYFYRNTHMMPLSCIMSYFSRSTNCHHKQWTRDAACTAHLQVVEVLSWRCSKDSKQATHRMPGGLGMRVFVAMTRVGVTMRSTGYWVGKEGCVSWRGSVWVCVCVFVAMTRVSVTMRSTGFWVGKEGRVSNRGSVCVCVCVFVAMTRVGVTMRSTGFWVGKEGCVSNRGSVCMCMCVCCDETSWWRDLRVGKEGRVSLRGSVCVWVGGWAGKKARVCE
jgi:hypothetical protein